MEIESDPELESQNSDFIGNVIANNITNHGEVITEVHPEIKYDGVAQHKMGLLLLKDGVAPERVVVKPNNNYYKPEILSVPYWVSMMGGNNFRRGVVATCFNLQIISMEIFRDQTFRKASVFKRHYASLENPEGSRDLVIPTLIQIGCTDDRLVLQTTEQVDEGTILIEVDGEIKVSDPEDGINMDVGLNFELPYSGQKLYIDTSAFLSPAKLIKHAENDKEANCQVVIWFVENQIRAYIRAIRNIPKGEILRCVMIGSRVYDHSNALLYSFKTNGYIMDSYKVLKEVMESCFGVESFEHFTPEEAEGLQKRLKDEKDRATSTNVQCTCYNKENEQRCGLWSGCNVRENNMPCLNNDGHKCCNQPDLSNRLFGLVNLSVVEGNFCLRATANFDPETFLYRIPGLVVDDAALSLIAAEKCKRILLKGTSISLLTGDVPLRTNFLIESEDNNTDVACYWSIENIFVLLVAVKSISEGDVLTVRKGTLKEHPLLPVVVEPEPVNVSMVVAEENSVERSTDVTENIQTVKFNPPPVKPKGPGRPPSNNDDLKMVGNKYVCTEETCTKTYVEARRLREHIKVTHGKKFNCPFGKCAGKRSYQKEHMLKRHIARYHPAKPIVHKEKKRGPGSKDKANAAA